jgi:hypothetical protein
MNKIKKKRGKREKITDNKEQCHCRLAAPPPKTVT